MPLVDDRIAIDKETNTVISFNIKAIEAGIKINLPAPAH
jgi:hypothetical protein